MIFRKIFYLFIIFSLFLSGCATTPYRGVQRNDIILKDLCISYGFDCTMDSVTQVIKLKRKHFEIRGLIGSNIVIVKDKDIRLSKPIRISSAIVYVPFDFETKVIRPLSKKSGFSSKSFRKIVVDAGHGGKDSGAIGSTGSYEKDIVFDIANRLSDALRKRGVEVFQTRKSDKFLSLDERVDVVRGENVDLFISIHANSSESASPYGLEVYSSRCLSQIDIDEICCTKKHKKMFLKYQMDQSNVFAQKTLLDMLYGYKQESSFDIASHLSKNTSQNIETRNRGAKSANFYVLKHTIVPAVLVEVGFLSNRKEEQKLKNSSYRQKIAESLANALIQYRN